MQTVAPLLTQVGTSVGKCRGHLQQVWLWSKTTSLNGARSYLQGYGGAHLGEMVYGALHLSNESSTGLYAWPSVVNRMPVAQTILCK